jgi:hypothetical protein
MNTIQKFIEEGDVINLCRIILSSKSKKLDLQSGLFHVQIEYAPNAHPLEFTVENYSKLNQSQLEYFNRVFELATDLLYTR